MHKFTKNNSGFTLLEIVMAAGLLAIIALGFARFMKTQMKSTKTAINQTELNNYANAIKAYMGKPGICKRSLGKLGKLENDLILDEIVRPDGKAKYTIGDKVNGTNFVLSSMYITNFYVNKVEGQDFHRAELKLNLELSRMNDNAYGGKTIIKRFEVDLFVNDSNRVEDCGVLGGLYLPKIPFMNTSSSSSETAKSNSASGPNNEGTTDAGTSKQESANNELSTKSDYNKAFEDSVNEAAQKTGQAISQEDINKAVDNNPELKKAMESLKSLQESTKRMEKLLNEEF
ncbi:prepilin-type N-terminal cleavage/methylation domain-containing protein [Halobacteriovorax sp. ZH4_bin.1]|uniref:type IV pilus modification PilV family protein n=1 Tax=unclassified Halobacteriovorax TaxID=2639665 RepID=UPI003716A85C